MHVRGDNPVMGEVLARRHDLDLLRAFAMMLGIWLHTAVAALALPGVSAEGPLAWFAAGVHGFRMPLFFVLSGFFTALLWQRRGPRGLLRDRSRRVALPLLVGLVTIIPMLLVCGYIGSLAPVEVADTGIEPNPDLFLGVGLGHLWFLWYLFLLVLADVPLAQPITRVGARARVGPPRHRSGAATVHGRADVRPGHQRRRHPRVADHGLLRRVLRIRRIFVRPAARTRRATDRLPRPQLASPAAPHLVDPLPRRDVCHLRFGQLGRGQCAAGADAWGITIGLIGLVRAIPGLHRPWVRYTSDASYWMYLAHLPLVLLIVPWVAVVGLAWPLTFVVSGLLVTGLLLWSYQSFIRYGAVGRLLNGPRTRPGSVQMAQPAPQ